LLLLFINFFNLSITYCISVWFSSCTMAHKNTLQRVINTAQKIIGHPLPSLKDLYSTGCLRRARSILRDSTHPGHRVFQLLPSGRRFRVLKTQTNRPRDSFYNRAIALLNKKCDTIMCHFRHGPGAINTCAIFFSYLISHMYICAVLTFIICHTSLFIALSVVP